MPAEAIRINRRVLLQCSIGAPGLKQPFAQPQQNGALSAKQASVLDAADGRDEPVLQFTARKAAVHLGSLHGVSLRPFRPHVRKNLNARFMPLAIQKPCPEREGP